jgi:hypothetical protein
MVEEKAKKSHLPFLLVVFAVVAGSALLLYTLGVPILRVAVQKAREAQQRRQVENNLRQLRLALENYHQTYDVPARPTSDEGTGRQEPGTTKQSREATMLHPDFPIVEGEYRMTKDWSITLPEKFNRRMEDDDLVIWRPGFTIWVAVWGNDHEESREERLTWLQEEMSPDAFDIEELREEDVLRFAYRLNEESDDARVAAFYGFAIGSDGHVQLAIYFDDENEIELARSIWRSLIQHGATTQESQ